MTQGIVRVVLIFLALQLYACDGSITPSRANTSSQINPDLAGKLVVTTRAFGDDADSAYLMDLETGRYTRIPNTDLEDQRDRFPLGIRDVSMTVSESNQMIAAAVEDCKAFSTGTNYSCIAVQDFDGNVVAAFDLLHDVRQVKLSPDGQRLALFRELDEDWLEIYDLSGTRLSSLRADKGSFDWLSDGRLVFSYANRSLAITEPNDTEIDVDESATLPSTIDAGRISFISASPDGRKIAFGIITDGTLTTTDATFWMFDRDSGALTRIARTPNGAAIDQMFSHSAWSPDGTQIAVIEGGFTGTGSDNPGGRPALYILPANADEPLTVSLNESQRSPEVILVHGFRQPDNDPDDEARNTFMDDSFDFYWLPD